MAMLARKTGMMFAMASLMLMAVMHFANVHPPAVLVPRSSRAFRAAPSTFAALEPAAAAVAPDGRRQWGEELRLEEEGDDALVSPIGLASRYVTIDITYMRWLWWPIILYLFWGMAFVCDVYFVRTIEVISERFQIPDDVAGATLMALGCNGPEMALNTINIFHPSNIGVGAVVGGEVFNVLVIIGTALLATPDMYMPLKLSKFNFFRDVLFYMGSVALLYWVLADGLISRLNAAVLLCGAVCYTLVVVYSSKISNAFGSSKIVRMTTKGFNQTRLTITSIFTRVDPNDMDEDSEEEDEPEPETIERWEEARVSTDPAQGSVLAVRVDVRNRLMDRTHPVTSRYVWLRNDALVVSTLVDPDPELQSIKRLNSGIVFDHNKDTNDHHWHHGGLVNEPVFLGSDGQPKAPPGKNGGASGEMSRPLLNETRKNSDPPDSDSLVPPPMSIAGFKDSPWEIIPLEDILYCERGRDEEKMSFNLHVHQHDSNLGHLITIELGGISMQVMESWVAEIRGKLLEQRRRDVDAPESKGFSDSLMEWIEWMQFPVTFFVSRSIPDMDDPKLQHLYPLSFFMSMFWLAIFAFSVVKACDGIHNDFGISDDILGFTVAAAGTSFPNVFSGMCVAKQGKTSMAVANALGANVQNVFLALAIPWTIQSFFIEGGPFPMQVDNLLPAVLECAITLSPVVIIYLCCGYRMPRWSGGLYLLTYVVYVIFALGQQVSKCPIWPLQCDP